MKKFSPIYSDNCIIYWPSFVGGVGFFCFCSFTLLIYFALLVLVWSDDNVTYGTICVMTIATLLILVWTIVFFRIIVRVMFCCITITSEDFAITNKVTATDTHILWEDVSQIEFKQESYRGRKQYRVYLKNAVQEQYIAIPISMVNEDKLHSMIPSELLINKPYSV